MAEHNDLGAWGEDEAQKYLVDKGFQILERDWKFGKRDLDIIAMNEDNTVLVFVEVKTRRDDSRMEPEQAVDKKKIRNLAIAANAYVKANHVEQEIRFDIVSITGKISKIDRIEHIENAFNPMLAF